VLVAAVLCCCCCFALAARLLRTEKRFAELRRRSTFHDIVLASQVQTAGQVRGAPVQVEVVEAVEAVEAVAAVEAVPTQNPCVRI
jgi:hypothetical protein